MREKVIIYLRNIEMTGLYMLFFFLPFFKVPKNIGVVLFIIGAIGWRLADKSVKTRKPDLFECILLGMFFIALASTIVNWPLPSHINGVRDTLSLTLIGWFLYRNTYSEKQIKLLLGVTTFGVLIGLVWGFWEWKVGISRFFDFRSMMVAETSIITGIIAAALLGVLFDSVSAFKTKERFGAAILASLFVLCLFLMGNRSGLLGVAVFFILLALNIITSKKNLLILVGIFVVFISFFMSSYILTSGKINNRVSHLLSTRVDVSTLNIESMSKNDQFRFEYWRVALAQISQGDALLLGVGPRNFRAIDVDKLSFEPPLTMKDKLHEPVHAHNLYLTKLCEEGLLGLIALLSLWAYVAWTLIKNRPINNQVHWIWVACLAAIIIPAIAGTFYAAFRREIAWVSMLFMGLALNQLKLNHPKSDTL